MRSPRSSHGTEVSDMQARAYPHPCTTSQCAARLTFLLRFMIITRMVQFLLLETAKERKARLCLTRQASHLSVRLDRV